MEYKKLSMRAYNLHMIKTNNFKKVFVEVNFRKPVEKIDVTYRNILSDILLESNEIYPDNRSLVIAAEKNYDMNVGSTNVRFGNYINSSFRMAVLNDKYTEKGSFDSSFDLFMTTLFRPNIKNKQFNVEQFDIVRRNLESQIKALKDSKRRYSIIRMLEIMDSSNPVSLRGVGYLEDLSSITPSSLYEYYQSMISNDLVDVFVLGDIDFDRIEKLFKEKFKINTIKKSKSELLCTQSSCRNTPQKVIEFDNITQAKLSIGCKLNSLTDFEAKYVMVIYNMILGEGSDSKFFKDIREKKSLCYYVNSSYTRIDNILTIVSGIDKNKLNDVIESIKISMKEITKGKFSDEDVEIAKSNIISSLNSIIDSPNRIINSYYSSEITGLDPLDVRKEQYMKVTKEDIINVSKKVKIDTIYLLSGGETNGKN